MQARRTLKDRGPGSDQNRARRRAGHRPRRPSRGAFV